MERIEASCSCGATFKVESNYGSTVHERFAEWQEVHKDHIAAPAPVSTWTPYIPPNTTITVPGDTYQVPGADRMMGVPA